MKARMAVILLVLLAFVGTIWWTSRGMAVEIAEPSAAVVNGNVAVFARIVARDGPDRLLSASSPEAESARIVGITEGHAAAIPADSGALLAADGAYVELIGVSGELKAGRIVPVELRFENSGLQRFKAVLSDTAAQDYGVKEAGREMNVAIAVAPNEVGGWQILLQTDGFSFKGREAEGQHVQRDGHGHLYLNGLKLGRMYGPSQVVGELPHGEHIFSVVLNANTHEAYVNDGVPVAAKVNVTQQD
ncbi:copper chaperone PCu(A)C [Algicella marina]|uniref:Copper chaperone PCu(A)C n=1 Tax=Algicella marina TaxID=2683284 RepID=A0A6P1T6I3_9RHOB|nr:copper chaperone PCu(A)C [Algicella marina]QHQ37096.1 copper chaperone PCu(A)C [Algicella marina]